MIWIHVLVNAGLYLTRNMVYGVGLFKDMHTIDDEHMIRAMFESLRKRYIDTFMYENRSTAVDEIKHC